MNYSNNTDTVKESTNLININSTLLTTVLNTKTTSIISTDSLTEKPTSLIFPYNPFFVLFIIQVRIINKLLKIFVIISIKIKTPFHLRISINLYKNNYLRNLQGSSYGSQQLDFYILDSKEIEPGTIIELTSQEEFNEHDRIVLNLIRVSEYEIKTLNNDDKFLDSQENEKMLKNGEIFDFNKNLSYKINHYVISSSTSGCKFYLISKSAIKENNQTIYLNFIEKNDKNNIIKSECSLSSQYNDKIECNLDKNINSNYILDPYIGSNNDTIFYLTQENDEQNLELNCQIEMYRNYNARSNKKKNNNLAIILITVGIIILVIIIVIIIIYYQIKQKKYKKIDKNEEAMSYGDISDSGHNMNQINDENIKK